MADTSYMADLAFLLLIFFLVSTTIVDQKGLDLKLPPAQDSPEIAEIKSRNLLKVRINSLNQLLVNEQVFSTPEAIKDVVEKFILNRGRNPRWSESPAKAVISIKTGRGTDYRTFIAALDEIKRGYYEVYGNRVGLSASQYRKLNKRDPKQLRLYLKGKAGIPMNISLAEPDTF